MPLGRGSRKGVGLGKDPPCRAAMGRGRAAVGGGGGAAALRHKPPPSALRAATSPRLRRREEPLYQRAPIVRRRSRSRPHAATPSATWPLMTKVGVPLI